MIIVFAMPTLRTTPLLPCAFWIIYGLNSPAGPGIRNPVPDIRNIAFTGQDGTTVIIPSCLDRELKAVAEHTLHHQALIALTLKGWGYELPHGFGVAPSTLTSLKG